MEIPAELMNGPRLTPRTDSDSLDREAPDDLDLVFGRGATRFGRPIRPGPAGAAYREGSGRPGAPRPGEAFQPTRDLAARRDAFAAGARSGTFGRRPVEAWGDDGSEQGGGLRSGGAVREAAKPIDRPIIPGERRYRDGDRVRHARWGDGIVVSSKLTRSDEEVTIAFRDPQVGRKTLLASLAGLELTG
jgi:hypothetical protein